MPAYCKNILAEKEIYAQSLKNDLSLYLKDNIMQTLRINAPWAKRGARTRSITNGVSTLGVEDKPECAQEGGATPCCHAGRLCHRVTFLFLSILNLPSRQKPRFCGVFVFLRTHLSLVPFLSRGLYASVGSSPL